MREEIRASHQLTLELAADPCFSLESFLISGSNEQAFDMIELWPDWPDHVLLLLGPAGSGKSHLAALWAGGAQALKINAADLSGADLPSLAKQPALLVEEVEHLADSEAALFHLLNLIRASGTSLLLTARTAPEHWGLKTADLLSRLRLAPRVAIESPDDALIRAVLVKLFFDRQLMVDTGLIEFAALRLTRGLGAARDFVAALDREALARGKRINRALASDVLAGLEDPAEPSHGIDNEGSSDGR